MTNAIGAHLHFKAPCRQWAQTQLRYIGRRPNLFHKLLLPSQWWGRYQILLGEQHECEQLAQSCYPAMNWLGVESATSRLLVWHTTIKLQNHHWMQVNNAMPRQSSRTIKADLEIFQLNDVFMSQRFQQLNLCQQILSRDTIQRCLRYTFYCNNFAHRAALQYTCTALICWCLNRTETQIIF